MTRQRQVAVGIGLAVVLATGVAFAATSTRRKRNRPSGRYAYPNWLRWFKVTQTKPTSEGWILTPPRELARQAGLALGLDAELDVEVYALARMIYSETGDDAPAIEKAAIGWAAVNRAVKRGWSLVKLATWTKNAGDRGLFGTQEHGRFIATTRDPMDADVYVATMILSGEWPDPTGGADQFFDPTSQQKWHEEWLAGKRKVRYRSAEEIIAKWSAEGKEPIVVPGVDPERQLFFRDVVG